MGITANYCRRALRPTVAEQTGRETIPAGARLEYTGAVPEYAGTGVEPACTKQECAGIAIEYTGVRIEHAGAEWEYAGTKPLPAYSLTKTRCLLFIYGC